MTKQGIVEYYDATKADIEAFAQQFVGSLIMGLLKWDRKTRKVMSA